MLYSAQVDIARLISRVTQAPIVIRPGKIHESQIQNPRSSSFYNDPFITHLLFVCCFVIERNLQHFNSFINVEEVRLHAIQKVQYGFFSASLYLQAVFLTEFI